MLLNIEVFEFIYLLVELFVWPSSTKGSEQLLLIHRGVLNKPFILYPGVPSVIHGSYSLLDETLSRALVF